MSIESLVQRGTSSDGDAMVVMVTHEAREADVLDSLARMAASPAVSGQPVMMHILDF